MVMAGPGCGRGGRAWARRGHAGGHSNRRSGRREMPRALPGALLVVALSAPIALRI